MTSQVWDSAGMSRGATCFCSEREHPWPDGLSNPSTPPLASHWASPAGHTITSGSCILQNVVWLLLRDTWLSPSPLLGHSGE